VRREQEGNRLAAVLAAVDRAETDPERHIQIQVEESLAKAIQAVKTTGDEAKVTLIIKVFPDQGSRVTFSARCEEKLPRAPTSTVTLFTDKAGNLLDSDPQQTAMDLTNPKRSTQEN